MARGHGRGQLGHDQLGDRGQLALALHEARDPRQVRLQPVLLLVAGGRVAQVGDHLVDVVLELGHLALGLDRDRTREVALGDRGRHLGDRSHLSRQVPGQLIDVLRQVAPGAGDALDLGLSAELALGADLAGHAGDLVGERGELVDHRVDGVLELEDLALRIDGDLLSEFAAGHGGSDLGDVAHLPREVRTHQVDVLGQVAPGAGDALDLGLSAELALGADLARHAGDLVGEGPQLVDHRVDGVLELADLTLGVGGDLLGEVAAGDGGGDLGDIAYLIGQVGRHQVDVLREPAPGAGDALDLGLPAELALGADLARHAGDLVGEGPQLVDHRVDGVLELEDLALDVGGDLLGEVAAGDGGGDLGDIAYLIGQVGRHQVDVLREPAPGAGDALDLGLPAELALGADLARHAGDLVGEGPQLVDHRVDGVLELEDLA